ncbi:MAG: sugar-binding protein [Elusimicrobiota bacterium]
MKIYVLLLCSLLYPGLLIASADVIMVDDFNGKSVKLNSLKKETGMWCTEPKESGRGIVLSFGPDSKDNPDGASLRIKYDIEPISRDRKPMCGYWTQVGRDLRNSKYLNISVRGDSDFGYPKTFVVEIKDKDYKTGKYTLEGVTSKWQTYKISIGIFREVQSWDNILEVGILFLESMQRDRGAVFIDDIYFTGGEDDAIGGAFNSMEIKGAVTLDGKFSDWEKRRMSRIQMEGKTNLEYGDILNRSDLSADIYSQWDNEHLYFLVDVKDNQLVVVEETGQMQESDGVLFYFDGNCDGFIWGDKDDSCVLLLPNGKTVVLTGDEQDSAENGIKYAVSTSASGYAVEAAFSWDFLKIKPEKNKEIGLSIAVQDLDISPKTKKGRINWVYKTKSGAVDLGRMTLK